MGFKRVIGVPLGQHVIFLETMNRLQVTPSILVFLNHFSPSYDNPVACAIESLVTSSCRSLILALKPSND
jgi:hypothetical protein